MADKEFSDDILNNQNSAKNDYHCHGHYFCECSILQCFILGCYFYLFYLFQENAACVPITEHNMVLQYVSVW